MLMLIHHGKLFVVSITMFASGILFCANILLRLQVLAKLLGSKFLHREIRLVRIMFLIRINVQENER